MTDLVGHFLLFIIAGIAVALLPLVIGAFVRPKSPTTEKLTIYECGEPTIGTSYIQFDLRFYVVALLFIIFDVEIAFFFPWAMVYGGAMQLADARISETVRQELSAKLLNVSHAPDATLAGDYIVSSESAVALGITGLVDILVFFGVLLVGFAYVWKRGDLTWVRAMVQSPETAAEVPDARTPEPVA